MMVTVNDMLITTIFCSFLFCFPFSCSARDNITWNSSISDFQGETLVSAGAKFELGFFTPNGSLSSRRYVGIWYYRSYPRTVVWVANRDNPLRDSNGVFTIAEDGNAMVLDSNNKSHWSANQVRIFSYTIRVLKLLDSGNLVLLEDDRINHTVWQSFDHPTDTFLPGMKMDINMVLTSWKSIDDPGPGSFTFLQDQDGQNQYTIRKDKSILYWQDDGVLDEIFSENSSVENQDMRLVMDQSGRIEYYIQNISNDTDLWFLYWWEPTDRCSVYNACGNFGSCNRGSSSLCKCLPAFQPKFAEKWISGDFSDGCTRVVPNICDKNVGRDNFLRLKMMKVGKQKDSFSVSNETECAIDCLHKCDCQAYSYAEIITRRGYDGPGFCSIWGDLDNVWENFTGGRDLSLRVAADKGSKNRTCATCRINTIPYPLSTGPNCGDRLYNSFDCNQEDGTLRFLTPNESYSVASINQERHTFTIQVQDSLNCSSATDSAAKILQLDQSLPFKVSSGCNEWSYFNLDPPFQAILIKEIEIGWGPPSEPICSSSEDCTNWAHTTCNVREDGHSRCLCNEPYRWNRFNVNCASDNKESNQRSIALHLYDTERHVKDLIESGEFREDDNKGIDVPFFDLQAY